MTNKIEEYRRTAQMTAAAGRASPVPRHPQSSCSGSAANFEALATAWRRGSNRQRNRPRMRTSQIPLVALAGYTPRRPG